MTYVHVSTTRGKTIDDFRAVSAKHDSPPDIDGLLVWAAGADDDGLHVVTMWQSKAYADRFEAEQLFPAFQALGLMSVATDGMEFSTYETGELYIRPQ